LQSIYKVAGFFIPGSNNVFMVCSSSWYNVSIVWPRMIAKPCEHKWYTVSSRASFGAAQWCVIIACGYWYSFSCFSNLARWVHVRKLPPYSWDKRMRCLSTRKMLGSRMQQLSFIKRQQHQNPTTTRLIGNLPVPIILWWTGLQDQKKQRNTESISAGGHAMCATGSEGESFRIRRTLLPCALSIPMPYCH